MEQRVIVLIEDDEYIREAFSEALDSEGYKVHSFKNGKEAVDGLKNLSRPSLILLDWMMPVMNGAEFLLEQTQNRTVSPSTPIVVVSAQAERIGKVNGIKACVGKPIDLDQLLETVKEYSAPSQAEPEPFSEKLTG